jgi:hypothetical protein
MAAWDAWTPDVAIDVPGCPSFTIERAVKLTVIDFLERTHWIQRTAAPIDIAGGAAERTFATPVIATGERVLAILDAWIDGTQVDVNGPADVADQWPDWKTVTGAPICVVMERQDSYYVVPAPTNTMAAALRLKVAVGLLETATACDDSIRTEWRDAIAWGAKARLMLISDQQWTSPTLAAVNQADYLSAVNGALLRVLRTPARRPLVTRPYFF